MNIGDIVKSKRGNLWCVTDKWRDHQDGRKWILGVAEYPKVRGRTLENSFRTADVEVMPKLGSDQRMVFETLVSYGWWSKHSGWRWVSERKTEMVMEKLVEYGYAHLDEAGRYRPNTGVSEKPVRRVQGFI